MTQCSHPTYPASLQTHSNSGVAPGYNFTAVLKPGYYSRMKIQPQEFFVQNGIHATHANAIKYIVRAGFKPYPHTDDPRMWAVLDLEKAINNLQAEVTFAMVCKDASHINPYPLWEDWFLPVHEFCECYENPEELERLLGLFLLSYHTTSKEEAISRHKVAILILREKIELLYKEMTNDESPCN